MQGMVGVRSLGMRRLVVVALFLLRRRRLLMLMRMLMRMRMLMLMRMMMLCRPTGRRLGKAGLAGDLLGEVGALAQPGEQLRRLLCGEQRLKDAAGQALCDEANALKIQRIGLLKVVRGRR